jgi:MinD-like ATPase involved in chromosome partitioning or flagellar assembly
MALANIGVVLAQWGYKILLIDWDLEAPGLERFYEGYLKIEEAIDKKGVIDLLVLKQGEIETTASKIDWENYTNVISIESTAVLHLITAGKRDHSYKKKLKQIDFETFYSDYDGGEYLESLREYWLQNYDFILIDSRTGLTDSSGVCSIHMPDILVLFFTPNKQSFEGIKNVSREAIEGQKQIIYDRFRLRTLPVPTRIEPAETALFDSWMSKISLESEKMLDWLPKKRDNLEEYSITPAQLLNQIKIPYRTLYAYGEKLAVIERGTKDPLDIGYVYETIAAVLANDLQSVDLLVDQRDSIVNKAKELVTTYSNPSTAQSLEQRFTIFFADVADSMRMIRKRAIVELEKEGYQIISDVPPPYEASEHEVAVREKLSKIDLAVHILDQFPGREINEEDGKGYPQKQVELSLLTNKPKVIWVPAEVDVNTIEEEPYRTFINALESGKLYSANLEYVRGTRSELSQHIKSVANTQRSQQKLAVPAQKVAVLLDVHYSDQLYAIELSKFLLDNGFTPFINPQEDDPFKDVGILTERISQVNKIVFIYGKASDQWILARMNVALQLIVTNNYPIDDFFVFMVPPLKDTAGLLLKQRFLKVNVLNNSSSPQFNNSILETFLQQIKTVA